MLDRQRKWNVRVATACFILQNMRSEFHEAGGRRNRIAEGEEDTTTTTLTNQQTFIAQSDSIQQVPSNHSPENSEVKEANGMFLFRCSNSKNFTNDSFLITSQQNNKQQRSKKL